MTTDKSSSSGVTPDALIFETNLGPRARGSRLMAMTAVAVAAGLALSLATFALPGRATTARAKAAAPAASFGRAIKLSPPLNAASPAEADAFGVSCPSFGNCVAGGSYLDRSGNFQPLAITDTAGRWARGVRLRLPSDAPHSVTARVDVIACPRIGDCAALGDYAKPNAGLGRVFAATESGGRWQQATELKLPAKAASPPRAQIAAVSCFAVGSCVATGNYWDSKNNSHAMLIKESKGHWFRATEIFPPSDAGPSPDLLFEALSCQHGQCVIGGEYVNTIGQWTGLGLVLSHGSFLTVERIKLPRNADKSYVTIRAVSCQGSGRCVIVGYYRTSNESIQPLSAIESNDVFTSASEIKAVPPNESDGTLQAVSCTASGPCVAVGYYTDTTEHEHAWAVTRSAAGHWGNAAIVRAPKDASPAVFKSDLLEGVSCFTKGCVAVGFYEIKAANSAFDPMAAVEP